jgi:hypothetical protein
MEVQGFRYGSLDTHMTVGIPSSGLSATFYSIRGEGIFHRVD